jgi:hypothetical protein
MFTLRAQEGRRLAPLTRAGCVEGRERRLRGEEQCSAICCRYHILGDIARRKNESQAVEAMRAWIEGETEGTCWLDIADALESDGRVMPDEQIAAMLGISKERAVSLYAESVDEYRERLRIAYPEVFGPPQRTKTRRESRNQLKLFEEE